PDGWFDELLLNAFPSLGTWSRDTGDKVAQSFGQPAPRSNWILNVLLDVFIALFVLGLTLWIRNNALHNWDWFNRNTDEKNGLVTILKFLGMSHNDAWYSVENGNVRPVGLYGPAIIICAIVGFGRSLRF